MEQLETDRGALAPAERRRVARHLLLDGFGLAAQESLAASRVVVVGAGGLGSPVLQYLAAAGVGTLGIIDDDVVEASNLQRQVLHAVADVGRAKTESAADVLRGLAPDVEVIAHRERLTRDNATAILSGYHLVVDGSDTFETRYAVAEAAAALGLPVVWGTVLGWDGQVSVFWSAAPEGRAITYPDVFGPQPPEGESCATVGVLSPACGVVGSTMAVEAVKVLTGTGDPALGRLLAYDARTSAWDTIELAPPPSAAAPTPEAALTAEAVQASQVVEGSALAPPPEPAAAPRQSPPGPRPGAPEPNRSDPEAPGVLLLDVGLRPGAVPGAVFARLEDLAVGNLPPELLDHPVDRPVVVVCERGLRSRGAEQLLRAEGWRDVTSRAILG
ncbi:ThiF family adenylyltransferase [Promicromonospora iranensis]|uniref:Adenylyltransferase/sulfurtransferase n=1 Tax=Promicromonospora iranensis TaxID=1105144 RepID=A0ABU2CSD0_9MICO|nr:ThiF family adenylyltransferase [Promicromonospora iranensis]MDR7384245.1 adenylyltransferase/sulfurtransferase [Promicromonospora iranensis]